MNSFRLLLNDDLQQQIRTHFDPKLEFSSEKFYLWRFKQKDEIHTICIVLEQKKNDVLSPKKFKTDLDSVIIFLCSKNSNFYKLTHVVLEYICKSNTQIFSFE